MSSDLELVDQDKRSVAAKTPAEQALGRKKRIEMFEHQLLAFVLVPQSMYNGPLWRQDLLRRQTVAAMTTLRPAEREH
jgi:hypothetical protein